MTDAESRSIFNRPDINALLLQMVEEESMSKFIANSKKIHARIKYDSFDFDSYCSGATYVPLEVALRMQREISNSVNYNKSKINPNKFLNYEHPVKLERFHKLYETHYEKDLVLS